MKQMAINNFIGGITWAIGVFVGSTFVVTLIIFIFSKIDLVPFVGDFVAKITENVVQRNSELIK